MRKSLAALGLCALMACDDVETAAGPDAAPDGVVAPDVGPDGAPADAGPDARAGDAQIADAAGDSTADAGPDEVPPVVGFLRPAAGAELFGAIEVEVEATDDIGVAHVTLTVDGEALAEWDQPPFRYTWNTAGLPTGPLRLRATARDAAGNEAAREVDVWFRSGSPLAVRLVSPAEGEMPCGPTWVEAEIAGNAETFEFRVDGEPLPLRWPELSATLWDAEPGRHRISVHASDGAGPGAHDRRDVQVPDPADCAAPAVALDGPAWTAGPATVTATTEGADRVRFFVDGRFAAEAAAAPFTFDFDEAAEGEHVVLAAALGADGRAGIAELTVGVDRTAPTVALVSPAPDGPVDGEVRLVATAEDAHSGVAAVVFRIGELELPVDAAPWEAVVDVGGLPSGPLAVAVVAVDRAGLEGTAEGTLRVDRPPTVAFVTPADGAEVPGPITVEVAAADDLGLASVELLADDEPAGTFDAEGRLTWVPALRAGPQTLRAVARDDAGQTAEAVRVVTVNRPATVALLDCTAACVPLAADAEVAGLLDLRAEITDDDGPPQQVIFLVNGDRGPTLRAPPYTHSLDTRALPDGRHHVAASVVAADRSVVEAAVEVVVNNCDRDRDGARAVGACGGDDCDDGAPDVRPGAPDLDADGVDQDCDGVDGPIPDLGVADAGVPDVGPDMEVPDAAPDAGPLDAGDPDPAGGLPRQPHWGPAARLDTLAFAPNPATSREWGCTVVGYNAGTTIRTWLDALGIRDLGAYLRPDAEGVIRVLSYQQAAGWRAGQTPDEVGTVDLRLLDATRADARNLVRRAALVAPDDADSEAVLVYRDTPVGPDGELASAPGGFVLPFPVSDQVILSIPLEQAVVTGRLALDGVSFAFTEGLAQGYWTRDGIVAWIAQIQAACASPLRPPLCAQFEFFVRPGDPPESGLPFLRNFFGGFDVAWNGGAPTECAGAACDSIGVCFRLGAGPDILHGVEGAAEPPCGPACDRLSDCAILLGGCPGLDQRAWVTTHEDCMAACAEDPELAADLDAAADCAARLAVGTERSEALGAACGLP